MIKLAESPSHRGSFLDLLALELTSREGRWAAVARITTGCVITVAIAMVFQIPEPTYMAYIVFLISKDERAATVTSAFGGLAAVTLAVLLTLGLSLIDTAEPALRLPLMAAATFAAMFTSRTFALGPISYLAGFVIVLLQSLVDDVPSPEALTRATLWTWVIILVPVVVTVAINLVFGQGGAVGMQRILRKILTNLQESLTRGEYKNLAKSRATLVLLLETAQHSTVTIRETVVTAPMIVALLDALVILESLPVDLPETMRMELAARVRACLSAIETIGTSAQYPPAELLSPDQPAPAVAFAEALSGLDDAARTRPAPRDAPVAAVPKRLFVADAFSNPIYWQFALKTTIAVMGSYVIYTLLDWPGLRTAIVTCFFVALSSLGETIHKLVLRLSGAIIGGLIAGLCIVFVLPYLTDIGQLCLLIGGVSVGAAWVATSSEFLSYAGMQMAFAFFLGILQGYGPATDLTVLRDRIVGILLGNILITIVFSSFWPESATAGLRVAIAHSLRTIGTLIRRSTDMRGARLEVVKSLVIADHFRTLSIFELRMLPGHALASRTVPRVSDIERLAGAAFVVSSNSVLSSADPAFTPTGIAHWAESAADCVLRNASPPPVPPESARGEIASSHEAGTRLAQQAIEQLESEVQRVASAIS